MNERENHPKIILDLNLYKLFGKVKSFYFINLDPLQVRLTNVFDSLILQANLKIGKLENSKEEERANKNRDLFPFLFLFILFIPKSGAYLIMSSRLLIYIVLAIVIGALFGGQFPVEAGYVAFLGTLFMNALKMIVVPLVVSSLIVGVANLGDLSKLGGIGRRTIMYYMATTGLSVIVGLVLVNIIQPGVGMTTGGETHTNAQYQVANLQVTLSNAELSTTTYDNRYQIILQDQKISGTIAPSKPRDNHQISVKKWESVQTGATATPQMSGTGIVIDLAVADVVRGKDRSIFDVLVDVVVGMIPTNVFSAMVNTEILPLIVFSLLFGGVLITLGDTGKPVLAVINGINEVVMKIVHIVVTFTPIGVFGLIAGRMSMWADGKASCPN